MRLVLAGFGNVGQAVAEQMAGRHPSVSGFEITGVSDPRFGAVASSAGLDPQELLDSVRHKGSFEDMGGYLGGSEVVRTIDASGADVLVELTFTDLETGEPATSHIRHALAKGMSVSTTNKGPIALHLDELESLARRNAVHLAYEGTVMSGTPTILIARESISHAGFKGAKGILNGTTNFIITRMEQGVEYATALAEAQELGYAEADPTGDVGGHDAAAKLAILTKALVGMAIAPHAVETVPLGTLTAEDVKSALETGSRWRYVANLEQNDAGWRASVAPRCLEESHPLASVSGATNAITFDTDLLGEVTLVGPGAGRAETAYSVINDLRRIAQGRGS